MNKKVVALMIFMVGAMAYVLTPEPIEYHNSPVVNAEEMKPFDTGILFLDIFLTNLMVCLLISYLGFFTGGILTACVLFWNGYLLAMVYQTGLAVLQPIEILYNSKHLPLELLAIFLCGDFGLSGYKFLNDILSKNRISFSEFRNQRKLILSFIMLLLASIIESI